MRFESAGEINCSSSGHQELFSFDGQVFWSGKWWRSLPLPVGIQLPSVGSGSMKFLKWPNFVFQYMTVKRQSEDDRRAARRWLASRTSEAGWRPVLVFPEGTNTNGKAIIQFKGGAFSVIYFYSFGPGQGSLWLIEFDVSLPCTQEFFKPNRSCCNCRDCVI